MRILIILLKPLSFIPALLMMYVIYTFSGQDAQTSAALSYKVSYKIVEVADEVLDADLENWEKESLANRFHNVTRKLAHMGEYFVLAISVAFPLYVYGMHGIPLLLTAGLFCVAFACGDEYHQSFVEGRGPQAKDVGIDSIGIFAGILVVRIIGWTGRMTIFRPRPRRQRTVPGGYSEYPPNTVPLDQQYTDAPSEYPGDAFSDQSGYPGDAFSGQSGYPGDAFSGKSGYPGDAFSGQFGSDRSGHPAGQSPSLSRRERKRREKELLKSLPPSDRLSDELRPGQYFRRFRK